MRFTCYGDECLKCPLKDCIRDLCTVDGNVINVTIKQSRDDRKNYYREYYRKHKSKLNQKAIERYHAKKERA